MSWRDLLRALDEEAAREVDGVRAAAARDAERALAEARRDVDAERQAALGRARAEAEARRRRAIADARREQARAVLAERRAILDEVRADALEHLLHDERGLAATIAAAAAEVGSAPSTWIVDPGSLEAVRTQLEREHADVLVRAELSVAPEPRGGFEVIVGRRVLDATAAARLERVWPDAEARLAGVLFGAGA